jgi:hypothetical protein
MEGAETLLADRETTQVKIRKSRVRFRSTTETKRAAWLFD